MFSAKRKKESKSEIPQWKLDMLAAESGGSASSTNQPTASATALADAPAAAASDADERRPDDVDDDDDDTDLSKYQLLEDDDGAAEVVAAGSLPPPPTSERLRDDGIDNYGYDKSRNPGAMGVGKAQRGVFFSEDHAPGGKKKIKQVSAQTLLRKLRNSARTSRQRSDATHATSGRREDPPGDCVPGEPGAPGARALLAGERGAAAQRRRAALRRRRRRQEGRLRRRRQSAGSRRP